MNKYEALKIGEVGTIHNESSEDIVIPLSQVGPYSAARCEKVEGSRWILYALGS